MKYVLVLVVFWGRQGVVTNIQQPSLAACKQAQAIADKQHKGTITHMSFCLPGEA